MMVVIIVPPIHIITVKTPQDQIEPRGTERNAQIEGDPDPVAGRTVVIAFHDVFEPMACAKGQFGAKKNVARRKTAPQVTPGHHPPDTVIPVNLVDETILVLHRVVVDVEAIPIDILIIMRIILRIKIEVEMDIDILSRRPRNAPSGQQNKNHSFHNRQISVSVVCLFNRTKIAPICYIRFFESGRFPHNKSTNRSFVRNKRCFNILFLPLPRLKKSNTD
jgi:hypothetical protein